MEKISLLQRERAGYKPKLPAIFSEGKNIITVDGDKTESVGNQDVIRTMFPKTFGLPLIHFEKGGKGEFPSVNVGVILSGGQAPGGHNVISGLFDGLKIFNPENRLYGF